MMVSPCMRIVGRTDTGDSTRLGVAIKEVGVLALLNKFCGRNEQLEK